MALAVDSFMYFFLCTTLQLGLISDIALRICNCVNTEQEKLIG